MTILGLEVVEGGLFEYTFKTLNEENQRIWETLRDKQGLSPQGQDVCWPVDMIDEMYNTYKNHKE